MPGVEVRDHVVPVARGVVLDEARRIERLRPAVGVRHGALRPGQVARGAVSAPVPAVAEESPRLVEEHPREDARMVVVAPDHVLEAVPVLAEHRLGRRAPRARNVRHDEEPEPVRPVELARNLRLDVDAVAGESEPLRDEYLVLHELVGREGVEAFGMVALVEGELQVDRLVVESHVGISGPGHPADADLAHAEVGGDGILHAFAGQVQPDFVEVWMLEVPQLRLLERNLELRRHLSRLELGDDGFRAVLRPEADGEREELLGGCAELHLGRHPGIVDIRREAGGLDVCLAARLEVDGLPDSAHVAVALLSVEPPVVLRETGRGVPDAERDLLVRAPLDELG